MTDAELRAAARWYLRHHGRRYVGTAITAVVLLLVVLLVPTKSPESQDFFATGDAVQSGDGGADDAGVAADGPGESVGGGGDGGIGGSGEGATATTRGPGRESSSAPQRGAAASATASGVAVSGTTCGPGVRQVPWSTYAPPCVPKFTGDNGGATAHGVSSKEIVIVYRKGKAAGDSGLAAVTGDAAPGSDEQILADLAAYIALFNRQFELYGRKVVLKAFDGQGDWLQEAGGGDSPEAQADAVTARNMGAFADVSFLFKPSPAYEAALAQQKVISMTLWGPPESTFRSQSPYGYSFWPSGTNIGRYMSTTACQRMAGLPAAFAGDPAYTKTTRTFGLIAPDNPQFQEIADDIENTMREQCGQKVAKRAAYAIDIPRYQEQAINMTAQMKAAGVTTLICYCDPIIPIFLTRAATQQQWRPEWLMNWFGDAYGRLVDQDQWAHAIANGGTAIPRDETEAYRAWKLASPEQEPHEQFFWVNYYTLLQLFTGLQAAGPNLNPMTFQKGLFSLGPTERGDRGIWGYGDRFTPGIETQIGWWDPNATSTYDGKQGAWVTCADNAWYTYLDPSTWAPARTQLQCFKR